MGKGKNLKATCTCPAFKKAGLFCKHVAFLLNGDDKLLIEPSNKIEDLKEISSGSDLLEKAKTYIPYDKRVGEKYAAKFDNDLPNEYHTFTAKSDEEAWEKARLKAEESLVGLEYISFVGGSSTPEVLDVLLLDDFMEKYFRN